MLHIGFSFYPYHTGQGYEETGLVVPKFVVNGLPPIIWTGREISRGLEVAENVDDIEWFFREKEMEEFIGTLRRFNEWVKSLRYATTS